MRFLRNEEDDGPMKNMEIVIVRATNWNKNSKSYIAKKMKQKVLQRRENKQEKEHKNAFPYYKLNM